MKRFIPLTTFLAAVAVAPLGAQGTMGIGHFVTTGDEHVPQLEQAIKRHLEFHRAQGDTWVWNAYQAFGGGLEYAFVSAGRMWADLDNMPIDMAADAADWARTGAPHTASIDLMTWNTWADVSLPPVPGAPPAPIVQTIDFSYDGTAASRKAIMNAMETFHAAASGAGVPFQYTFNEVIGSNRGPQFFVAVFMQNFAGMDADDPAAMEAMLESALGRYEAERLIATFDKHLKVTAARFWVHRPDLSYTPSM